MWLKIWTKWIMVCVCVGLCLWGGVAKGSPDGPPLQKGGAPPTHEGPIPQPLEDWVSWTQKAALQECPFQYSQFEHKQCIWHSRLKVSLDGQGGRFHQHAQVFKPGWVVLPGDKLAWPMEVMLNHQSIPVMDKSGSPAVLLPEGEHILEGQFQWPKLPSALRLPKELGIYEVEVNGQPLKAYERDTQGRIKLRTGQAPLPKSQNDHVDIQVYRKLSDTLPFRDLCLIRLKVSGKARTLTLNSVLLNAFVPIHIQSPLNVNWTPSGQLQIDLKPGVWEVRLTSHHLGKVTQLRRPHISAPWPDQEIWSFEPQPSFRVVEVNAADRVDPHQSQVPQGWQQLAAYSMVSDAQMTLLEKYRGQRPKALHPIHLNRSLWLDFSNQGWTFVDAIHGELTSKWRLNLSPPYQLGRVRLNGQEQLVTIEEASQSQGVEIREGIIDALATGTLPIKANQPLLAAGWDVDFSRVNMNVHLPVGWQLLAVKGVDKAPGSWLEQWDLLAFFLVLIMAVSFSKLFSIYWGIGAFCVFTLMAHEPGAPIYSWLNVLAVIALLRVIPKGRLRKALNRYYGLSIVLLIIGVLPFVVTQFRQGIYPQLAQPNSGPTALSVQPNDLKAEGGVESMRKRSHTHMSARAEQALSPLADQAQASTWAQYPTDALIQTGPGIPQWKWNRYALKWNGPVLRDQKISMYVLSSHWFSVISILRALGCLALLYIVVARTFKRPSLRRTQSLAPMVMGALLGGSLLSMIPSESYASFPSRDLLDELKTYVDNIPECVPHCASVEQMHLSIDAQHVVIRLKIHAQDKVAVPIPSALKTWRPRSVSINGQEIPTYQDHQQTLWAQVDKGVVEVVMKGPVNGIDQIPLSVPHPQPKSVHIHATGWKISGISNRQLTGQFLHLDKVHPLERRDILQDTQSIAPFVQVKRILKMGVDWELYTEVTRVAPKRGALKLSIPLMPNESPLSESIKIKQNEAHIQMSPRQHRVQWRSRLKPEAQVEWQAAHRPNFVEIWQVDARPIWHLEFSGVPLIQSEPGRSRGLPTWRPYPGETLKIHVDKPKAVLGPTLSFDKAKLISTQGKRATDNRLELKIRSSQGGTHRIELPENAILEKVNLNRRPIPLAIENNGLLLPIQPGEQTIQVSWRHHQDLNSWITTPKVNLNQSASNVFLNLTLPQDRWILALGGPSMGPAVLFWGVLLTVLIGAVALSKSKLTPLNLRQWLLLGIGISVAYPLVILMVVFWFIAFNQRAQYKDLNKAPFNWMQVGLVGLTLFFLVALFYVITQGLLGFPNMQLQSPYIPEAMPYGTHALNWFQDLSNSQLAQAWVLTVPMSVYRILMLLWALWLSFSLIRWLIWGWAQFSTGGIWKKTTKIKT